ncbi:hypothetical protein [Dyella caseinilytica]|nr:hypothetical protein [Dyella caseinilytica]
MSLSSLAAGVALVCVMGWAGVGLAANPPSTSAAQPGNHTATTTNAQPANVDGFGMAVSAGTLEHYSGGSSLVQSNQNLTGAVTGNSASQVVTGTNSITGDSFAGASGLPSVIQNSGNNVLIQNGVIVNVQMKP